MSHANLSRRALVAGAASVPALALPAVAIASAAEVSGPDKELRRLWSEYSALAAADDALLLKYTPARAAYDAEQPPCPEDVSLATHLENCEPLWRKHGLDELTNKRNSIDIAMRKLIAAILSARAEGMFGVAVKLSAQPAGAHYGDSEDFAEAIAGALEDIDCLLGSQFSARFNEIYEPLDYNRTWQDEEGKEAELDEAESAVQS